MVSAAVRIVPASEGYPRGLDDLEEPPPLWLLGSLQDRPGIAVVGSRRATRYGIDLAEAFGAAIGLAGWTTVSGLARGVDTAAHRGCMRISGHAVAVLGSGIDVCYPRENTGVYDEILETGGAVLSEYPPGTPPDRWRFPARNRIIAALSAAVVVVESAATGGALITARLGAELGRPVFVVPGDVDREMSEGCNMLIKDGAHPVLGADDLVTELGFVVGPPAPVTHPDHGIPVRGVPIGELPGLWSLTITESLAKLGRLELEGRVKRVGDHIVPT